MLPLSLGPKSWHLHRRENLVYRTIVVYFNVLPLHLSKGIEINA
jgi:hypothetical protein